MDTEYHSIIIKSYDSESEARTDANFDEFAKLEAAITIAQLSEEKGLAVASEVTIVDLGIHPVYELEDSYFASYRQYPDHFWLHRARMDVWMRPAIEGGTV